MADASITIQKLENEVAQLNQRLVKKTSYMFFPT
jgi:hypothetical protein